MQKLHIMPKEMSMDIFKSIRSRKVTLVFVLYICLFLYPEIKQWALFSLYDRLTLG